MVDQAVVSGGTFIVSVLLARGLPASGYGTYVLLLGGLLTLQLFNATLLFHPLSVRMPVAAAAERPALLSAALALVGLLSACLGCVLAATLAAFGRSDLIVPALCAFLFWQAQETFRRGLLTTFRHRKAVWGDAVCYLGQAALVGALSLNGTQSVAHAFYGMAATSAVAAAIQWRQLGWRLRRPRRLAAVVADFWSIGGCWALGNGLLMQTRFQLLTWVLAGVSGPAAAASFQAAQNVVNLSNPIMIGFGNVIPQAAAQARPDGAAAAWRVVRSYAALAVLPIAGYSILVTAAPSPILSTLYGGGSVYAGLAAALRLLILAGLVGYAAEFVVWYMHGVTLVPLALAINAAGALATAVLVVPLVGGFGLRGACVTLITANLVRLIMARAVLLRVTAPAARGRTERQTRLTVAVQHD